MKGVGQPIIGGGVVLTLCLAGFGRARQTVDTQKWNTVEQSCGRVEFVDETPVKGNVNQYNTKSKPIKRSAVRLYRRETESVCCGGAPPVAEALTNRRGEFEFKNVKAGNYWVVIVVDGKEYSHPIKYAPDAKDKTQINCSHFLYDLKNGQLQLGRVIDVD
jgi:hypothetical protein